MTEFQERRHNNGEQATVLLVKELAEQVKELKLTVSELKRSSAYANGVTAEMIEKAVRHAMSEGFPDGDAIGHRKDHEQDRSERDARRAMWDKVKSGLVEKAIWAAVIGIAVLLSFYFSGAHPK